MVDKIITPLIAVGLAVLVWMYTRSRDQGAIDNVRIPVEVQIAGSQADLYDLDVAGNGEVVVSFIGPPSRIRQLRTLLHHGELRTQRIITVPEERLNDSRYSEALRIDASEIPVPAGVQVVVNETHNRIPITMTRLAEKRLKVDFRHSAGDRISQVAVEPLTVTVKGPKELLDRQDYLAHPTELFQVPSRSGADEPTANVSPVLVPMAREISGKGVKVTPSVVAVKFTLVPDQKDHEAADVPIHFLTPENFALRPKFRSEREGFIKLKLRGPANVDKPPKELIRAYVDLTKRPFQAGIQGDEPIQIQLPPGFKLAGPDQPRLPAFELVPANPMKPVGSLLPAVPGLLTALCAGLLTPHLC